MFIDDLETKGPAYMQNLADGRTALALDGLHRDRRQMRSAPEPVQ